MSTRPQLGLAAEIVGVLEVSVVKDCPKCGTVNPPEALRCDCGYDFASREMKQSYLTGKDRKSFDSPHA
jgi:hypothetical protein